MDKDRIKIIAIFITIFLVLCGYFYLTQGRKNVKQNNLAKQIRNEQTLDQDSSQDQNQNIKYKQTNDTKKKGTYYTVHVAGEVKYPGVYSLDKESRVIDAINKAGGITESADLDRINLAEYIKDAEKIRIPNVKERIANDSNFNKNNDSLLYNNNNIGNAIENIISSSIKPNNNYNLDANNNFIDATETIKDNNKDNNNNNSSVSKTKTSGNLININTADTSKLQELPGIGPATAKNIISYREQNGNFSSIEDLKAVPRIGDKTFDKLKDSITVN